MSKKTTFKKFFLRKSNIGLMLFIAVILFLGYMLLFWIEEFLQSEGKLNGVVAILLDLGLNAAMILFSVFVGAILSAILIERTSSEAQRLDTLLNEVLSCSNCLDYMGDENKTLLEKKFAGIEYDVQADIFSEVKEKLFEKKPKFYFEECSYMVTCTVYEDYIEKKITRTVKIRSYEPQFFLREFSLVKMANKQIAGQDNLEITSVEINGKRVDENKYKNNASTSRINEPVLLKNNYDTRHCYKYVDGLPLRDNKTTTITVKYITRVEPQDTTYCCRVSEHCKAFDVDFTITNPEKYNMYAAAFGFIDTANGTPNNEAKNNIKMSFRNWIFENDGVCINFQKEIS